MMDERDFEVAAARAEAEYANLVGRAVKEVAQKGSAYCEDCGGDIPADRRAAAPFARRCLPCQTKSEKRRGQHAA